MPQTRLLIKLIPRPLPSFLDYQFELCASDVTGTKTKLCVGALKIATVRETKVPGNHTYLASWAIVEKRCRYGMPKKYTNKEGDI